MLCIKCLVYLILNPIYATGFSLYFLKTSEKQVLGCFEWVWKETGGIKWVNNKKKNSSQKSVQAGRVGT